MAERFVVDASPLILLARIDRLDILTHLSGSTELPRAVFHEVEAGSDRDRASSLVAATPGIRILDDIALPYSVRSWDLGMGESQVLAHGLADAHSEVVLDDLAARRCARSLGLPMVGTLGLVILSRHRGLIAEARPLMEALQDAGLRLEKGLVDAALAMIGE